MYDNVTSEAVGLEYTSLRTDPGYIVAYVMWYRLVMTIAVPFVLMLLFNIKIIAYYRQNR